jgi:hypothetical protein
VIGTNHRAIGTATGILVVRAENFAEFAECFDRGAESEQTPFCSQWKVTQ